VRQATRTAVRRVIYGLNGPNAHELPFAACDFPGEPRLNSLRKRIILDVGIGSFTST